MDKLLTKINLNLTMDIIDFQINKICGANGVFFFTNEDLAISMPNRKKDGQAVFLPFLQRAERGEKLFRAP